MSDIGAVIPQTDIRGLPVTESDTILDADRSRTPLPLPTTLAR